MVPDGVLVFFSSYALMANIIEYWKMKVDCLVSRVVDILIIC